MSWVEAADYPAVRQLLDVDEVDLPDEVIARAALVVDARINGRVPDAANPTPEREETIRQAAIYLVAAHLAPTLRGSMSTGEVGSIKLGDASMTVSSSRDWDDLSTRWAYDAWILLIPPVLGQSRSRAIFSSVKARRGHRAEGAECAT